MTKKTARVMVRTTGSYKTVPITGTDKPDISEAISSKWQRIITLCARLLAVPSGLIMRITQENMEVFLKSANKENPYPEHGADQLGHGLYCETVIGNNHALLVPNALDDPIWADNPDVPLKMISYYGLPILWPDQEAFGTICVLDNKTNHYNETFKELMMEFKLAIESDLALLVNKKQLTFLAERDPLTALFNRRKITAVLNQEHKRSARYQMPLTIAMMDLDRFKQVNDRYGHDVGDQVLKTFARAINARIREIDRFGRWGGDEFLLICPNTDAKGAAALLGDISILVTGEIQKIATEVSFSYGIAQCLPTDERPDALFKRADQQLYKAKKRKRPADK
ncbi:sensor domain-containing diguanylate cyclase [Desulfogranum mediterraneum]|uniref:sensor domain-containing diguanylate cyclase n=1 Tax=Desulfogranum mediterraneum TaxID=160661 RepID=UPI001378D5D5|nr:sensor domain-containing diguanylate cyclase [Desulfogranum mediterraneum]